jgi:hypothetical protein
VSIPTADTWIGVSGAGEGVRTCSADSIATKILGLVWTREAFGDRIRLRASLPATTS